MTSTNRIAAAAVLIASAAGAQAPVRPIIELRPFVGAFIPVGKFADDFKAAPHAGVQVAVGLGGWRVVTTSAWTDARSTPEAMHKVQDLWQWDWGAEYGKAIAAGGWTFRPFVGAGIGGRTYEYAHPAMSNTSSGAGYAAIGHEAQRGALGIRAEARNYVSRYAPDGGPKSTRDNLGLMFGAVFRY